MTHSAARATALTLLHDAAASIASAQRVLGAAGVLEANDATSVELLQLLCRVSAVVQQIAPGAIRPATRARVR